MGHAYHFTKARKTVSLSVLTPRQIQFCDGLVAGMTSKEMGFQFGVSQINVTNVIRAACERTGNRTREQLSAWWAVKQFLELGKVAA